MSRLAAVFRFRIPFPFRERAQKWLNPRKETSDISPHRLLREPLEGIMRRTVRSESVSVQLDGPKVVRGGSWRDRPFRARSAFRLSYPAYQRVFNVGFRVVLERAE